MKNKFLVLVALMSIQLLFAQTDTLEIMERKYYEATEDTSAFIDISYPEINGLSDLTIQDSLNKFLENTFKESIEWYTGTINDTEFIESFPADYVFNFETSYEVTFNSVDLLSILLNHYEYTGGAHGNYYFYGININTKEGKILQITDFIQPDKLVVLSHLCEEKIMDMYEANSLLDAGLFEDELILTEDQDFFITANTLVLQFDPYEIGPYVMGSIEVEFSFGELNELLKTDYPFLIR